MRFQKLYLASSIPWIPSEIWNNTYGLKETYVYSKLDTDLQEEAQADSVVQCPKWGGSQLPRCRSNRLSFYHWSQCLTLRILTRVGLWGIFYLVHKPNFKRAKTCYHGGVYKVGWGNNGGSQQIYLGGSSGCVSWRASNNHLLDIGEKLKIGRKKIMCNALEMWTYRDIWWLCIVHNGKWRGRNKRSDRLLC